MSSKYPILDNKPIDQWKVTELKDELRRRKLAIKGLKDDLIKRLAEALSLERENSGQDVIAGDDLVGDQPEDGTQNTDAVDGTENSDGVEVDTEAAKIVVDGAGAGAKVENVGDLNVQVDINDSAGVTGQEHRGDVTTEDTNSSRVKGELPQANVDTRPAASENVSSEATLGGEDTNITGTQLLNGYSEPQLDNEGSKPQLDNEGSNPQVDKEDSKPQVDKEDSKPQLDKEDSKPQLDIEDPKPQLENEGLRSLHKDVMLDTSAPNNQVSEVSPNLGFQVKSDSISTDSVSINEKIEIKDNIISDNVKLELDVVKPEMVEPSTKIVVPVVGENYPMDVEEPQEKMASVEEKDDSKATNADMGKKNDIVDVGYSEKLNLDRNSGDDSMEEDVVESKQIDSKYNSVDMGDKIETSEMHVVKGESPVDVLRNNLSTDEKDLHLENQSRKAVPSEKRKLNDQNAGGSSEPLKRQRRWNTETHKVPEPQSSNLTPTITPKDAFQPAVSRRNFSPSDSTLSNEDAPKERVVPPSQKPPTNSLRIDRFLRPFTLKAVQELLGKTGKVTGFWMDHIKTHCYVSYTSEEEAVETRNAVYNLQWPPNGGHLLVAEFVDPQEVKSKLEGTQSPAVAVTPGATAPPLQPQHLPHQQVSRQQLPPPPALPLPPPPLLSNVPPARERFVHPPPPPPLPLEKHDPPIVTLDDLFRKTRATPRIYYLPLSEEQVAAKLAERSKHVK